MADDIELKLYGRLSFFRVYDPQDRKNDAGQVTGKNYNTCILLPKDDPQIAKIKEAMAAAKKKTWGDAAPRFAPDQLCLRDGCPPDEEGNRAPLYDGYDGMFFVSANRPVKLDEYELIKSGQKKRPVRVIGPRKNAEGRFDELNDGDPYAPYSGCYANVVLRIYGYVGKDGQKSRINASLEAVQFAKDGERFGNGGVDVDSVFDELDTPTDDMGGAPAKAAAPADDFDIG
jgi:hypothetical protein